MKHLLSILPSRCVSSATGYEVKTKGPGRANAVPERLALEMRRHKTMYLRCFQVDDPILLDAVSPVEGKFFAKIK